VTLHFLVPRSTEVRAFEWETSGLIGGELHSNGYAFRKFLINMEGFQVEPVTSVECCNDEPDLIISLGFDLVGGEFVFPGRYSDLSLSSPASGLSAEYAEPANTAVATRAILNRVVLASFRLKNGRSCGRPSRTILSREAWVGLFSCRKGADTTWGKKFRWCPRQARAVRLSSGDQE
jgi:hypothetical protein